MGAKLGSGGGPMADINVTPLIDVVLVLLVVFMVITPLLSSGLPVDLPLATTTIEVNDVGQHVVISLTKDGRWAVEQEEVTADDLITTIQMELNTREPPEGVDSLAILIKADGELEYQQVREVMDIIADKLTTSILIAANKEQ